MDKAKQISGLGPTVKRQKILKMINYLGEIFSASTAEDEESDITDIIDRPDLESEESAAQRSNQSRIKGQGLKILTPKQIFSRLPISLAQLKAENNSGKLKNEIRQLSCSLYRSRKLAEIIYKSLINIISEIPKL